MRENTPEVVGEGSLPVTMPLGLILALSVCPAMLGTQEAIRQSQSKSKREEHRARRCNLVVSCVKRSIRSRDINNKLVVLRDNKVIFLTQPFFSFVETDMYARCPAVYFP